MKVGGVDVGPRAVVCGMLERDGKALFLSRKGPDGEERFELPWVIGTTRADPIGQIAEAYQKKTDIKVRTGDLFIESEVEEDGRMLPVLVFRMETDAETLAPYPGGGYTGFRWMSLEAAKKERLGAMARWLSFL